MILVPSKKSKLPHIQERSQLLISDENPQLFPLRSETSQPYLAFSAGEMQCLEGRSRYSLPLWSVVVQHALILPTKAKPLAGYPWQTSLHIRRG